MKFSALAAASTVAILLLAGCGGDNSSSSVATNPATTTAGASATTSASGSNSSGSDSSTSTPTFSGDANSEFCSLAKQISSSDLADEVTENAGDLKATFDQLQNALQQAHDKAPSEIKDDLATVQATFQTYAAFLAKYDYDFTKITQAATEDPSVLTQATQGLDSDAFTNASARINAYAQQVCGIQDTSVTS